MICDSAKSEKLKDAQSKADLQIKTVYRTNRKTPSTMNSKLLQKIDSNIYFIENDKKIRRLYQQYGKWFNEPVKHLLKAPLQEIRAHGKDLFVMSQMEVGRIPSGKEMADVVTVCDAGTVLCTMDVTDELMVVVDVEVPNTAGKKSKTDLKMTIYVLDISTLKTLAYLDSFAEFNDHARFARIVKGRDYYHIILVEGKESGAVGVLTLDKEKKKLVYLKKMGMNKEGMVNGLLCDDDLREFVCFGLHVCSNPQMESSASPFMRLKLC